MEIEDNEINVIMKLPFHKRTTLNYTHTVNIDSQINIISTWRKSKIKFNKNFIKNIFTFGILHIFSLFYPKLYVKLYCKPCSPKESDFFLIEDINGELSLCKSIHKRPKIINSSSEYNFNYSKTVTFEYNTIKYEYDEKVNIILPIFFDLSKIKNNELIYKYSEGLKSEEEVDYLYERYGKNEMKINRNTIYFFFLKQNLRQFIMATISSFLFEFGNLTPFGIFIFSLSILIILIRIGYKFLIYKRLYNEDNSLDGKKNMKKYKVIRKIIKQSQNKYCYIYHRDILPGDILLLREKDIIPCDGVILEGECILNANNLLGKTDQILKSSLECDNNYFNYIKNKNNIVLHGMKIVKIYSKNISKEITFLAINTGSNSYKANLFSNLMIKKDKKDFKTLIKQFIGIYYIIYSIAILCLSIFALLYIHIREKSQNSFKKHILTILGLILMPINNILENSIRLISIIHLNSHKIQCADESILPEAGNIDTVIFSKSGIKPDYKILAFCPLFFLPGTKKISIKQFEKSEEENINKILDSHMKYYRNIAVNSDNDGNDFLKNVNDNLKNEENNALFLHCLVCCTSLEKINNEICGENMDKEILEKMKWDINSIEVKNEISDNQVNDKREDISKFIRIIKEIKKKGNIFINNYDNNINYNSINTISEIYPKDYYKITEEKNLNYREKRNIILHKRSNNNLNKNETKLFKLIILHKFHSFSCWNKSCITYNLLDDKCRFMTKGPPDKIIKYCSPKSIPDIDKIFSKLIKDGYKIIAYATKILNLNQIDKNKNEEHYLKDLSFVGFIIIEKSFKKEVSHIIDKINKMNCNNSISSIISTNDNIYNSIEGGLKNGIINKNNVYVFDIGKGENNGKVVFAKFIYDKDEKTKEQKYKPRKVESNKSKIKPIYEDNNILFNNQKQNNDLNSSERIPDSSRKIINSESNQDIQENNQKNSNTYDEKAKNNEEENYLDSNIPLVPIKRASKAFGTISSFFSKTFNIHERIKKQSFNSPSPKKKKNNFLKPEDSFNLSTFGKESKGESFNEDESSHLKYKKRRPTTKELNFTFRSNTFMNYEYLFFTKYENQIRPFKHDCVLCFSGKLIEYIYNRKNKNIEENNTLEKYKLDILMTLIKDRVKIFYSMNPENKSTLIKIYRKYLNKSVCFVGNSASDIESIVLSNIGIMIGPPLNLNTLFCHYYLCDKSLFAIEKILKNSRSYYENISLLLSVNSIFTLLSLIFIIFTYKLNTFISPIRYIFINSSVFLLCLSAFSIETNYSVDINYLAMNGKLFLIYNIIKIIGTIIIKLLDHLLFWIFYKNNDENSIEVNNEILTIYFSVFTWAHITTIIFAFNQQSFFRKNALNNIIFIFLSIIIFEYLIINLTLSDFSLQNLNDFLFINFDSNKNKYNDVYEDNHKLMILQMFSLDIVLSYLLIKLLKFFFEKYANKKY